MEEINRSTQINECRAELSSWRSQGKTKTTGWRQCLELTEELDHCFETNDTDRTLAAKWASAALRATSAPYSLKEVLAVLVDWERGAIDCFRRVSRRMEVSPSLMLTWRSYVASVRQDALLSLGDEQGEMLRTWFWTVQDQYETTLTRLQHDRLTGILNEVGFIEKLDEVCAHLGKRSTMVVVFCEFDGLREVNRAYGGAWGNYALQTFAIRLQSGTRDKDLLGRIQGAAFAVCVAGGNKQELSRITGRVRDLLAAPLNLHGAQVRLPFVLGTAEFPKIARDAKSLLRAAEVDARKSPAITPVKSLSVLPPKIEPTVGKS